MKHVPGNRDLQAVVVGYAVPWCNQALGVLSLMRMIAYNVVARFKLRRLRRAKTFYWSWEQTLGFIKTALFSFHEMPDSATL